jgi:hypothetical protein
VRDVVAVDRDSLDDRRPRTSARRHATIGGGMVARWIQAGGWAAAAAASSVAKRITARS